MKKLLMSMLFAVAIFSVTSLEAQVKLNVNVADQPQWGPAGYDYAEYYYMPDIETYYYVPRKEFVYFNDNKWQFSPNLPQRHSNYDLYTGHKVVFKSPNAYKNFKTHKVSYAKYKNHKGQVTLKQKGNNGNHYGQYKNKSKNGNHNGQKNNNINNGNHNGQDKIKSKGNGKGKG